MFWFLPWLAYQLVGILTIWVFISSSPEVRFWRYSALITENLTFYICLATPWWPSPCHSLTDFPPSSALLPPWLYIGYALECITLQHCSISELTLSLYFLFTRQKPIPFYPVIALFILWYHWGFFSVPLSLNLLVPPSLLALTLLWHSPNSCYFSHLPCSLIY